MGAIAGYLGAAADPRSVLGAMVTAAPHRGPRTDFVSRGRCALAACWSDAIPDAAVGESDGLAIAFVGTLDNRADLAQELSKGGSPAASQGSDGLVKVIADAYRTYGLDFPSRLRGVFAGVVTDGSTVYCFRDQLGYKPLFYRHDGASFWVASEPKQVVAGAGLNREPDLDIVAATFYRSLDDLSPAALRGVDRLPKMTALLADGSGAQRRRYWFPERLLETGSYRDSELQDRFDSLMTTAVRRSLTGRDVLFLSGGIDSPAIAGYGAPVHRELYGRPLPALTFVYPKYPTVDESRYVTMLAEHYAMPLHTFEQKANAMADLGRWTALADTPYRAAALSQYEESNLRVRDLGLSNILTGEHAEFLVAIGWYTLDHYLSHGRVRSAWRELRAHRSKGRPWREVLRRAGRAASSGHVINAANRLRRNRSPLVPAWVDEKIATSERPVPVRDRWRRSQLGAFIGPGTSLEAEEICQAVCNVTVRRPWTDIDLWEFFLSLPAEQKFPDLGSKSLVKTLLRNRVPDAILDRTDKTVFDEAGMARIDYQVLEQFLLRPDYQLPGVDYGTLGRLITEKRLSLLDYQWARDLANIHAFLGQWESSKRASARAEPARLDRPDGVASA
jgi:asparagine synthetase B (glutamine-hydrolysing)